MSIADVLAGCASWSEALALTRELLNDPSSRVGAAINGLQHPWPREAFVLADLYDLLLAANWPKRSKPKPYPRPTDPRPTKYANPGGRSQAEVLALLASRGHHGNPPARKETRT